MNFLSHSFLSDRTINQIYKKYDLLSSLFIFSGLSPFGTSFRCHQSSLMSPCHHKNTLLLKLCREKFVSDFSADDVCTWESQKSEQIGECWSDTHLCEQRWLLPTPACGNPHSRLLVPPMAPKTSITLLVNPFAVLIFGNS